MFFLDECYDFLPLTIYILVYLKHSNFLTRARLKTVIFSIDDHKQHASFNPGRYLFNKHLCNVL